MSSTTFSLSKTQQQQLLSLARASIAHGLKHGKPLRSTTPEDNKLQQDGACFVTLTIDGELRGCIGSLEAHRPLWQDVAENAFASAFRDPRFPPLSAVELEPIHIEISVLTPLEEISFRSEQNLLAQIVPGVDGLVLEDKGYRGTFWPLVWQQLPDKQQFFAQLKRKAGMPAHYWSDTVRCYRYHTLVFEEDK